MLETLEYERVVGSGAFAHVSRYKDKDRKNYAVKKLKNELKNSEEDIKRFKREIAILEALKGQPNIIPLVAYDLDDLWYIMPFAEQSLYSYITKNNQTLEESERLAIFESIVDGVSIAHSKSILHRDITPNNVLKIGDEWFVCDFGLGKDYSSHSVGGYSSVQGYGSYNYAAPEQIDKLKDASVQSDIFSLGKIFYFILTGREPRDTNDAPSYKSVIKAATSELVESRYDNISVFKSEVLKYKTLYAKLGATEIQNMTVREYINQADNVEWREFYEVVMKENVVEHIYYDFIEPIVTLLKDTFTIREFYKAVESDILEFTIKFREALEKCYNSVGWPFSALNSFGYFMNRLYKEVSNNSQCQLECLKEMWNIAASQDQWAIQEIIIDNIHSNSIMSENAREFALYIVEMNKSFAKLRNVNTSRITSTDIVRAITSVRD